jgi:hypothetical protein
MPKNFDIDIKDVNSAIVQAIENKAKNTIEHTLDGVIGFLNHRHKNLQSNYKVFKEIFVLCWAGVTKEVKEKVYYNRVDIELINEQVKLFYSTLDEVSIEYTEDYFKITEYVHLGLNNQFRFYPLEEVTIHFKENGSYYQESKLLFEPPYFNKKTLHHIYNANNALMTKLKNEIPLSNQEEGDLQKLAETFLICYLNDFADAKMRLLEAKPFLKKLGGKPYDTYKESVRILRKVKYS